jgi:hypothetical protein
LRILERACVGEQLLIKVQLSNTKVVS